MAKRFFQEMLDVGITPDVQAMNSLINAFSKAGSPEEALKARRVYAVFFSFFLNLKICKMFQGL